MSKNLVIAVVAVASGLALIIMLGLFHRRLTPEEYDAIQMCAFSDEARRQVEATVLAGRTTEGSGRELADPVYMRSRHQDYRLDVAEDGVIQVQSRSTGVSLWLKPVLRRGSVQWESRASPEELSAYCRP